MNHCHNAITLIKQYQAEKLSAELGSCLLRILKKEKVVKVL